MSLLEATQEGSSVPKLTEASDPQGYELGECYDC